MTARFTVLGSGSGGNASLLHTAGCGLLVDCGLGVRHLGARLNIRGYAWRHVSTVILTHTHSDHWKETSFANIMSHGIIVWCHPEHAAELGRRSPAFAELLAAGRVRFYSNGAWCELADDLRCLPLELAHDGEPTFGFRFEGAPGLFGPSWALAYAADLGHWNEGLARALADVDVLAVEFNHDEVMQQTSGRPEYLIRRVLGSHGHLSNGQAAGLVRAVLECSSAPGLRALVTLHRSRDCNTVDLVRRLAGPALQDVPGAELIIADQYDPTPTMLVGATEAPRPKVVRRFRTIKVEVPRLFEE